MSKIIKTIVLVLAVFLIIVARNLNEEFFDKGVPKFPNKHKFGKFGIRDNNAEGGVAELVRTRNLEH